MGTGKEARIELFESLFQLLETVKKRLSWTRRIFEVFGWEVPFGERCRGARGGEGNKASSHSLEYLNPEQFDSHLRAQSGTSGVCLEILMTRSC